MDEGKRSIAKGAGGVVAAVAGKVNVRAMPSSEAERMNVGIIRSMPIEIW